MPQQLGDRQIYHTAIEALEVLKQQVGKTDEIKAIARLLLYAARAEVAEPLFPYVGDANDPRDQAIVAAYNEAWQSILRGEDDE